MSSREQKLCTILLSDENLHVSAHASVRRSRDVFVEISNKFAVVHCASYHGWTCPNGYCSVRIGLLSLESINQEDYNTGDHLMLCLMTSVVLNRTEYSP